MFPGRWHCLGEHADHCPVGQAKLVTGSTKEEEVGLGWL